MAPGVLAAFHRAWLLLILHKNMLEKGREGGRTHGS